MATLRSSNPLAEQGVSKFNPLQLAGEKTKTGNGPTNNFLGGGPSTKLTQEDQDNTDEEAYQESVQSLIQTWVDNLTLISVITTFFVSTEASLIAIAIPPPTDRGISITSQIANIGLMSALVMHTHAAVISFFAVFVLIRYKLDVAQQKEEEAKIELVNSSTYVPSDSNEAENARGSQTYANGLRTITVNPPRSGSQIIRSTNPRLVQVGPFWHGQPPIELLARCRSLCIFLSFLGFLFAIIGALSFSWGRLPLSVSICSSVLTGLCVVAALSILITPLTKTSHKFCNHKFH
ncbi:hypothetical protein BYT27DRAFT_6630786 [Phlegmacium glaucopus]|nr:hypothetical protein BYT27DRAFT_6630786 [Phlegmacium glaucopus]